MSLQTALKARTDAESANDIHYHRMGERCWCGYLSVPSRFYEYDDRGRQTNSQEQAEAAYLEEYPANKVSLQTDSANLCECGNKARPRGKDCWKCYRRRRV